MSFSQNLLKTWSSRPATESPWWSAGFSSLSPSLSSSAGSCLGIQLSSTSDKLSFCCSQSSLHPGQERLPRNSLWQEAVASPLRPRSPPPQPRLKPAVTRQPVVKLRMAARLICWHLWHARNSFWLSTAKHDRVFHPRKRTYPECLPYWAKFRIKSLSSMIDSNKQELTTTQPHRICTQSRLEYNVVTCWGSWHSCKGSSVGILFSTGSPGESLESPPPVKV